METIKILKKKKRKTLQKRNENVLFANLEIEILQKERKRLKKNLRRTEEKIVLQIQRKQSVEKRFSGKIRGISLKIAKLQDEKKEKKRGICYKNTKLQVIQTENEKNQPLEILGYDEYVYL
jgi:vacuolar-type H+-ATPase subunit I/STV1